MKTLKSGTGGSSEVLEEAMENLCVVNACSES